MKFLLLSSAFIIIGCRLSHSEDSGEVFPRVITPLGAIEGIYDTSSEGKLYKAFLGIPYVNPITAERRFEIAEPVSSWTGVLSAKTYGPSCMQLDALTKISDTVIGSEDCLHLNVFTPARRYIYKTRESTDLMPVIIFIHGGGFQSGSSAQYGPVYLMNKPVILVTFNYRLGPLGFLSTEDDVVPGNMGLKDQVLALRWVKDNILYFGGDPERVTLTGHSVGGTSVHYHYLSEASRGLFQRGMSLSGNALDPWAQDKASREKAKKLAAILGCPSDDTREMVNCLKTRPAEDITHATVQFKGWMNLPIVLFAPVVEVGKSNLIFIDRHPMDLILSGNVQDLPWITSTVSEEGLLPVAFYITNATAVKELNDDWERIAPYFLEYNYTIPKSEHSQVAQWIRDHYFGPRSISFSTIEILIRMVGDRWFSYQGGNAAQLQALAMSSPVRYYYFSYRGVHSVTEVYTDTSTNYGVMHLDDVGYVFNSFFDPTTTQADRAIQKLLIRFWVSFATHGVPDVGIEWLRLNPNIDKLEYLHFAGPNNVYMDNSCNFGDKDFWKSIPFLENNITLKYE